MAFPIICCIDGNIGAGKTTLLDELERRGHRVFKEELNTWGWCLTDYYADPNRWAFTLQMAILHSMAMQYSRIVSIDAPVVFIERSPESGMVFTRNSYRHGTLTSDEMELVDRFYKLYGWNPHITVKLTTSPARCMERVRARARECEKNLSVDYLTVLDEEYAKLDAIDLDGTLPLDELVARVELIICRLKDSPGVASLETPPSS